MIKLAHRVPYAKTREADFCRTFQSAIRSCQMPRVRGEKEILRILKVVFELLTITRESTQRIVKSELFPSNHRKAVRIRNRLNFPFWATKASVCFCCPSAIYVIIVQPRMALP